MSIAQRVDFSVYGFWVSLEVHGNVIVLHYSYNSLSAERAVAVWYTDSTLKWYIPAAPALLSKLEYQPHQWFLQKWSSDDSCKFLPQGKNRWGGWMHQRQKKATVDTFSIKLPKFDLALMDCDNAPANTVLSCHSLGPNIDHGLMCYVYWVRSNSPGVPVILMTWENRIHIST